MNLNNFSKKQYFIPSLIILFLSACGDSSTSIEEPKQPEPPIIDMEGDIIVKEGTVVEVIPVVSDDGDIISYNWEQISGQQIELENSTTNSLIFNAPDVQEEQTYQFKLTVVDDEDQSSDSTVNITIQPFVLTLNTPDVIASNCNIEIDTVVDGEVVSGNYLWQVADADGTIVSEGNSDETEIFVDMHGSLSLSVEMEIAQGIWSEATETIQVEQSLPSEIQSQDYVVESGTNLYICGQTNVWRDASLTIKEGTTINGIKTNGQGALIKTWGNVNILGTENERISISGVIISDSTSTGDSKITIAAHYTDFIESSINNERGRLEISHSTFNDYFNYEGEGYVINSEFKKGLALEADGTYFLNNNIHCEAEKLCWYFDSYMFGDGFLNNKPTIENNNVYIENGSYIAYGNESFTGGDIDVIGNYWSIPEGTTFDDIFIDAKDEASKSRVFIYDPYLLEEVSEPFIDKPVAEIEFVENSDFVIGQMVTLNSQTVSTLISKEIDYEWVITNAPDESALNQLTGGESAFSFIPDMAGQYEVGLIVSTDKYDSPQDSIVIDVTLPEPNARLTSTGIFGETTHSFPYSTAINATVSVSGIPTPTTYTLEEFSLKAEYGDLTIINLNAVDSNSLVSPYFSGLTNDMIIKSGDTVSFSLITPLTNGAQADITYTFEVKETGDKFTYRSLITTN